jgi:hypothetical protein
MLNNPSHADPLQTADRVAALDRYFVSNVTASGNLICATSAQCQSSHQGNFYKSQLHHIGSHYDLICEDRPLRIVVVGQEYGSDHEFVSLAARHHMVATDSGLGYRFKARDGFRARNSHMRGCTSLLRLIFRLGLGVDHDGEFLHMGRERIHIFECFALVNFLLCSAVAASEVTKDRTRSIGGGRGCSTETMRSNCSTHFKAALKILEPTHVVAQGYGVREWIAGTYGLPAHRPADGVEQAQFGGATATLITFSHPSARGALNWGANAHTPYLVNIVEPTIRRVMRRCGCA